LNNTKLAGMGKPASTIDTNIAFPNNGTTKVTVKFLGGPDRFEYNGFVEDPGNPGSKFAARQFGDVVLDMGAGNDTVLATQLIAKNVTINSTAPTGAATDNDTITIAAGGLFDLDPLQVGPESVAGGVRTNLTINGQTGSDAILLAATVGGNITATLKDAGDSFRVLGASRIGGNVTVTETPTTILGVNVFQILENSQVGKNVTFTNTNNAGDVDIVNATIGGNVMLNSGSGKAGSGFDLQSVFVGGNLDVKGGLLADEFHGDGLRVGKNLTVTTGDGGNGGIADPDTLLNSRVAGNATFTYAKGDHALSLTGNEIFNNFSFTGGDGLDRLTIATSSVGKNFSLTGGIGGNGGAANPDIVNDVKVGGTFSITYGTGNEQLQITNCRVNGAAAIKGGNGDDVATVTATEFYGALSFTGGLGVDSLTLSNCIVGGATTIITSGGNDAVNITVAGRYKGKVTINTGGAGLDDDNITVNANGGQEIVFLGGVSITTGAGTDTTTMGTSGGIVVILNGLAYAEGEVALTDTFNFDANNLIRI